ncbi:MAG: FAD-binding oxidoreductase [Dermatophilaceae bacterium]
MPIGTLPGVSPDALVTDPDIALTYAVDASEGAVAPADFTVVRARDREDVVAVLREAQAHGIPVVPQAARTSLTGASLATEGCIVLNVEALTDTDIDQVESHAVVGPGVVTLALKTAAADVGLYYPPDPASAETCTIGGNIATNAGGLCCIKYGVTSHYVKALEVVLAGGEVIRTGHRTAKGVAGYDLTGLFVGSEGTLGVVTSAVVHLVPQPDPALAALATFSSLERAVLGILALRADRHRPCLLEFLDRMSIAAIQQFGDFGFPAGCEAVLLVQSDRPGHTGEDVARYAELLSAAGADDVAVADDRWESDALMAGRRMLSHALEARGARLAEDACVPVGRLGEFVTAGQEISARTGVQIALAGHGGDGNLHPSLYFERTDPASLHRAEAALGELLLAAIDMGGTITGEHGVGVQKRPYLTDELGPAEVARQRAVKALFDPLGVMNPGKVYERS